MVNGLLWFQGEGALVGEAGHVQGLFLLHLFARAPLLQRRLLHHLSEQLKHAAPPAGFMAFVRRRRVLFNLHSPSVVIIEFGGEDRLQQWREKNEEISFGVDGIR